MPKKDRGDSYKAMKINEAPTDEEQVNIERHLQGKTETKI
jgi:hypothetical protein